MEVQEAIRQAQAHLQNAMELVPRPVGKEELLYMWDNQITALDNFLADTEVLADDVLRTWRGKLRDAKKKLTDSVIQFEAQAAGEEVPDDEPTPDEWVQTYIEAAEEMKELIGEALGSKVEDVKDLVNWEEPLAVVNGYLADSEPFQEASKDLRRARSIIRVARKDLQNRIKDVLAEWRRSDVLDDDDED